MGNELLKGTRRTGDFYDTHEDTPQVKVTLERSESGISVTVAWSNSEVPYAAWFVNDDDFPSVIEDKTKAKTVPKRVLFHDSYGFVLLIHCWARGFHANVGGPGSGTLWARAAVLGVRENKEFDQPHGLQTEISGLRQWLGVTSWKETRGRNLEHRDIELRTIETTTLHIGDHAGVTLDFRTGWNLSHEEGSDRRVLLDILRCTTRSAEPLEWEKHMQLHRAIRDLLVMSRWRDESCVPVRAMRKDDPLTTVEGESHGEQWREVVVPHDERKSAPNGYHPHLIRYEDIGAEGINRWISLRDQFSRALDPIISSLKLLNTTPQTLLAHTGPGLEALGYLLMLRDAMAPNKAAQASLKTRLERIVEDLGDCPPFSSSDWVEQTVANYNGIKHANRTMPDELSVLNSWADSVMAVRGWVALELGIPKDIVTDRLANDRQPRQFVKSN